MQGTAPEAAAAEVCWSEWLGPAVRLVVQHRDGAPVRLLLNAPWWHAQSVGARRGVVNAFLRGHDARDALGLFIWGWGPTAQARQLARDWARDLPLAFWQTLVGDDEGAGEAPRP